MERVHQHKYGLFGKFTAKHGKADELLSILLDASELVSKAKGCHLYLISKDAENGNNIWVNELWDSKEDHDNSLNVEGVKELIMKAIPLIDGQPEKGVELEVIGGAGISE